MTILCDTCEKDLSDCTCADVHPFCYVCGNDLDGWESVCGCGNIVPWNYDSLEEQSLTREASWV